MPPPWPATTSWPAPVPLACADPMTYTDPGAQADPIRPRTLRRPHHRRRRLWRMLPGRVDDAGLTAGADATAAWGPMARTRSNGARQEPTERRHHAPRSSRGPCGPGADAPRASGTCG